MEDSYQDKRSEKLLGVCKFLYIDSLSRISVIWQNLSMNSKEKGIGNGKKNTKEHLMN